MRERKSSVDTTKLMVVWISSVSCEWKSRKSSRMEGRRNGIACTIARVIQIKNAFGRKVAVNVRTVLMLLMVEIAKNMKPML